MHTLKLTRILQGRSGESQQRIYVNPSTIAFFTLDPNESEHTIVVLTTQRDTLYVKEKPEAIDKSLMFNFGKQDT